MPYLTTLHPAGVTWVGPATDNLITCSSSGDSDTGPQGLSARSTDFFSWKRSRWFTWWYYRYNEHNLWMFLFWIQILGVLLCKKSDHDHGPILHKLKTLHSNTVVKWRFRRLETVAIRGCSFEFYFSLLSSLEFGTSYPMLLRNYIEIFS